MSDQHDERADAFMDHHDLDERLEPHMVEIIQAALAAEFRAAVKPYRDALLRAMQYVPHGWVAGSEPSDLREFIDEHRLLAPGQDQHEACDHEWECITINPPFNLCHKCGKREEVSDAQG